MIIPPHLRIFAKQLHITKFEAGNSLICSVIVQEQQQAISEGFRRERFGCNPILNKMLKI
jgi:hypothetical protein